MGRSTRLVSATLAVYLVAGLIGGPVAAAAELKLRDISPMKPVPVSRVSGKALAVKDETHRNTWQPDKSARWPAPGSATLDVAGVGRPPRVKPVGSLPVSVARAVSAGGSPAASRARVQVLDQATARAAGVDGVLIAIQGHGDKGGTGRLRVEVDYSAFAGLRGGNWGSRLVLRAVPSCAAGPFVGPGCTPGRVVSTRNDGKRQKLSAVVDSAVVPVSQAGATLLVRPTPAPLKPAAPLAAPDVSLFSVTAAPSGSAGNFTATSLAPSSSWTGGGSTGGFSWSYKMDTPDVPGGLKPDLDLSYSSQSIDGRTASTNNQGEWIGDGWSLSPGYIERRYTACEDDKKDGNNPSNKVGDQCWKKENAVLSLGGATSELVSDDTTGWDAASGVRTWRKKDDDGTKVELRKSANRGNGDQDGEHWLVTKPDGTRYYFGYNRLPGWVEGKEETNSTWTTPVFGNHAGEPCHATAFKDSWCQQAWRWNLDYVVDTHSNAMAYYWAKDENHYQLNIDSTYKGTPTPYTRGGYLKRIEYGLRSNRMYADEGAAKVDFAVSERCVPVTAGPTEDQFDCAPEKFTKDNAKHWPDVPFDQYCASKTDKCEGNSSPTFFLRKRLTQVTTSVLDGGAFKKVDAWTFKQTFEPTPDGKDPAIWLAAIDRTGYTADTSKSLPSILLFGVRYANRVEGAAMRDGQPDPVPAYSRLRVTGIKTESGSTIGVTYSDAECKAGSMPSPSANNKRCYPVIWSPPEAPAPDYKPYLDWFHTYVVTQVLESANVEGGLTKRTDYAYPSPGPLWTKSDDEFTKPADRTWGVRRGYSRVQTRTGDPAITDQTLTETRFFRGVAGAAVADSEGTTIPDHEAFAGMTRETATFNGVGGPLVSATSYTPWRSATPTATSSRAADNLPSSAAYQTGVAKEESRTTVVGAALRRTETSRTFDDEGFVESTSETGDKDKAGDESCTTTSYARNAVKNMLSAVAETTTVAKPCGTAANLPTDLVGTTRTYYDGATAIGAAPTLGDETRRDENNGPGTGFITVSTAAYDAYGRQTSMTDGAGSTTTFAFTPATGQVPTKTVTTNELGHATTVYSDPRRGVTTAVVDPNNKRTDVEYDGLGRVDKVWRPGWSKTDHPTLPSVDFAYRVSQSVANVVTTKQLQHDGSYAYSYAFYDGLLRPIETQAPAIGDPNGAVISETRYDTRGLVVKQYNPYYAKVAPSTTLWTGDETQVPSSVETVYDGAERPLTQTPYRNGDAVKDAGVVRRTSFQYGGDRTTVIPPTGGTATTTITDALGRKVEQRAYTNAARTEFESTLYAYEKHGKLAKLTDPAKVDWTWTYDARGRETKAVDPDKGTSTTTYDNADRPVTTTDARGSAHTTSYDALGRPSSLSQGAQVRAKWTYDTVAKGQLTATTHWVEGQPYTSSVGGYTDVYQPTSTSTSLPDGIGDLAGTYTWTYGYNEYTGVQEWVKQPALGNLPSEYVTTVLGEGNLPQKTTAGQIILVNAVSYDEFARPVRTEYGNFGRKVFRTQNWDEHTGELRQRTLDGEEALRIEDTKYTYDAVGNVKRISSTAGQGAGATTDNQCFKLDALRRMTDAWTTKSATDDCTAGASATTVGGPDSYWYEYEYDIMGNRSKEVRHSTGAGSVDVTRDYVSGKPGEDAPHALRSVKTTGGPDNGKTEVFTYDATGNTVERKGGARSQKMTWDAAGNLETVTEGTKKTSYTYDTDGNRVLAHNADGSRTAYLPGGNELTLSAAGSKTAVRYYTHGGETVAVRTGAGIDFLFGDQQGTALIAVAWGAGQAVTRRKQLPFGGQRSSTGVNWPGDRGFVGGVQDPTGMTHLGAREYDPQLGRFLSVDPLLITDDPAQHNPYIYGNNNPATFADPTGEAFPECRSGQYVCNGDGTEVINYGKNYAQITEGQGGTVSPGYVKQQNQYRYMCSKDPDCVAASAKARAEANRKAAEAQRKRNEKESGLWNSIRSAAGRGWDVVESYIPKTMGFCGTVSGSFGVSGGVTACLASDFAGNESTAISITPSFGLGGVEANLSADAMYSNADDFSQLAGWAGQLDANVGEGPVAHASLGTGGTENAKGALVYVAQAGGGVGLNYIPPAVPANLTAAVGYTFLPFVYRHRR
ncbi:RHS repeat-associated core domain-containing protein [Streptomyces sp. NPDC101132]|uniref:RHS repeat-associated core domain-containing protein n=1 Tax=Streptomyces sp. NPDC101132 TaxID=3366110 RepID=UPI0037F24D74